VTGFGGTSVCHLSSCGVSEILQEEAQFGVRLGGAAAYRALIEVNRRGRVAVLHSGPGVLQERVGVAEVRSTSHPVIAVALGTAVPERRLFVAAFGVQVAETERGLRAAGVGGLSVELFRPRQVAQSVGGHAASQRVIALAVSRLGCRIQQ
jgi:hypothetical protein